MAEKPENSMLKLLLEIGPIIGFFLAYRWAPVTEGAGDTETQLDQIMFATMVFIPLIIAALAASWVINKHLPRMAVVTAILVVVFGGLWLWAAARGELSKAVDGRYASDERCVMDEIHLSLCPVFRGAGGGE